LPERVPCDIGQEDEKHVRSCLGRGEDHTIPPVRSLNSDGMRKLSELLLEVYAPGDLPSFRRRMLKAVHGAFDGEMVCHNEINLHTGESLSVLARPIAGFESLREAFFVHVHEHPSIQHLIAAEGGETVAIKTSDFVTQRQWRNTGLYREFYRELDDIRYQLTIGHRIDGRLLFFAVSRKNIDFTESERALLSVLRPHFIQAYENAHRYSQATSETRTQANTGQAGDASAWLTCNYEGQVLSGSEAGWQTLERWFPPETTAANRIPQALRVWLGRPLATPARLPKVRAPFRLVDQRGDLEVRVFCDPGAETYELRFFERLPGNVGTLRSALGVSRREADVLRWLMEGKTNEEIAQILGLGLSTVKTHVSSLLRRLDVETRSAAVSRAMEMTRFRPVMAAD
jgi:DNA-binding CsgD family transcriptional regulator